MQRMKEWYPPWPVNGTSTTHDHCLSYMIISTTYLRAWGVPTSTEAFEGSSVNISWAADNGNNSMTVLPIAV